MRALIAGNWKMNGLAEDARALAGALKARAEGAQLACDLLVCPPFPHLGLVAQALAGSRIAAGGQDCNSAAAGAPRPEGLRAGTEGVSLVRSRWSQYQ